MFNYLPYCGECKTNFFRYFAITSPIFVQGHYAWMNWLRYFQSFWRHFVLFPNHMILDSLLHSYVLYLYITYCALQTFSSSLACILHIILSVQILFWLPTYLFSAITRLWFIFFRYYALVHTFIAFPHMPCSFHCPTAFLSHPRTLLYGVQILFWTTVSLFDKLVLIYTLTFSYTIFLRRSFTSAACPGSYAVFNRLRSRRVVMYLVVVYVRSFVHSFLPSYNCRYLTYFDQTWNIERRKHQEGSRLYYIEWRHRANF